MSNNDNNDKVPCKVRKLKKPGPNQFDERKFVRDLPRNEIEDHQKTVYIKADVEKRPPAQKANLVCVLCGKSFDTYNYLAGKSFICDGCIRNRTK